MADERYVTLNIMYVFIVWRLNNFCDAVATLKATEIYTKKIL